MLGRILDAMAARGTALPALRHLSYGGGRMPVPVIERAMEMLPHCGFVNAYGLTETSSTIAVLGPDDHRAALTSDDPAVRSRLGSVGRFVPGVEGQIRADDGTVLPAGTTGELYVRGGQVSGEYVGSGSVLDGEGWFPTKDRALVDVDGYIFIEGRSDDTIIRGGENIAPAEIEDVLVQHPSISDVAVVGLPDDEWGQRIVAVLVVRSDAAIEPDEARAFVRERLRGSRTPDDVVFVDELPYNATGKLLRKDLMAQLLDRPASS
jgi:acyl-CoA synthetase (AMP-forming)/AMP-acid ligase II